MQIKSGPSYFREETDKSIIFRSNNRHIEYWLKHLLPAVIVLYDANDILYWEVISEETIRRTGKGWRVDVPKRKTLSTESLVN
jgi:hypothetical protein